MVAGMLSMMNAAKATRLVASLVIQWFHQVSGVSAIEEARAAASARLGGESMAERPNRALPRRSSEMVVAWWICERSCRMRELYSFS